MGFCNAYDDVAIYTDSMIYSNLTCFYQIKFIFCTMSNRVVECVYESDFLPFSLFTDTPSFMPIPKGYFTIL